MQIMQKRLSAPAVVVEKNAGNKKGRAVHALFTVTDTASAGATYPNRRRYQQHFAAF